MRTLLCDLNQDAPETIQSGRMPALDEVIDCSGLPTLCTQPSAPIDLDTPAKSLVDIWNDVAGARI